VSKHASEHQRERAMEGHRRAVLRERGLLDESEEGEA